ncbi:MAG: hypothetical protein L0Z52_12985 [Acidobacteria bacterium]|nr:hypothetical protein [Acidobacteriota bacterium]
MRPAAKSALGILATCALFAPLGCGNPCATQDVKVEGAIRGARAARADLYAPEPLQQAVDSLRRARQECRLQASNFYPLRSYRDAQALFNTALQKAEEAVAQAKVREGMARQEALNSRYEAGMAVNEALVSLRRAREFKGDPTSQALLGRLDGLRAALGELQRRIDAGEYLPARELGSKIREEAVRLQGDANRGALSPPP